MSLFGFSTDLGASSSVAWGDGMGERPFPGWPTYRRSIDFSPALTIAGIFRGDEYAIGPEGGVSYTFMENYKEGHHNLGLFAGLRGDFFFPLEQKGQFWGLRLSAGYKAEIFHFNDANNNHIVDNADHGIYGGFYVLHAFQGDRCTGTPDNFACAGRGAPDTGTAIVQSAGLWFNDFPGENRGAVGVSYSLGFEI